MDDDFLPSQPNDPGEPPLSVQLLGPPRLEVAGQQLRLSYAKAEALLIYLAATGQPQLRAALADLLWGDSPQKQARNSLRSALYTLRRALPADLLRVQRAAIALNPAGFTTDAAAFEQAIESPADTAALAESLRLWRGPFLADVSLPDAPNFESWLQTERVRYDALYSHGLLQLAEQYSQAGQLTPAQRALEKLLAFDPLHESGHQQLMRLYLQQGNRAAALRQYETLRHRLSEELGVDPAHATQTLHLEILRADTSPAKLAAPLKPARRHQFVGRQQELSTLHQIYRTVLPHGPARLVILEGEPGIGKTRLAQEWLATLIHTRILTTRCFQSGQAIPFQPWIDLIRATLRQLPLTMLGLSDVWLTELAHLVPEIRLQRPDLEPSPITDPELTRGRIIQAIGYWLEKLCLPQPVCILIDDWQWLDQASLTALRHILGARHSDHLPLLMVGTQRSAEPLEGWASVETSLARDDLLRRLPLKRLSLPEVTALARSMKLPAALQTEPFFARLLQETEGNPLFLVELLQTLTAGGLAADADWPTPPTVQSVIQNRLNRLTPATRQVLGAAAVLGRAFADADLRQTLPDQPVEATLQAIDEAIAANIITEQDRTYDFTHDKIRAVLLAGLTRSRQRYLNLQIGQALEAAGSTDFGRMAHHFAAGGDALRARDYALRAARQAVELYADDEALRWYDTAETLLPDTPPELSAEVALRLTPFQQPHVSRALPLDVAGLIFRQRGLITQRLGRYNDTKTQFDAALARGATRQRPDEQAAAHNLLSFLAYLRSDYEGVGNHAQLALDLAAQTNDPALRAPGLRHLGIAVYRTGNYARARQLYDEALAAYRQADDQLGLAGVYNNIGFVLRTQNRYAEAIAAFEQALAIYRATGQIEGIALIHSNVGRTHAFSGDFEQALAQLHQGLALSQEAHTDWITVKIHRTLGSVYFRQAQWPPALEHARQARALAESLGSDEDLGATLRLLAQLAAAWPASALGDPTPLFEQSIALLQQVGAQDELELARAAFARYQNNA